MKWVELIVKIVNVEHNKAHQVNLDVINVLQDHILGTYKVRHAH